MNVAEFDCHKVTPDMLEKTMLHFGWLKVKIYPERAAVWQSKSGDTKLWVPLNTIFDDYKERIDETVKTVAAYDHYANSKDVISYLKQMYMAEKKIDRVMCQAAISAVG
ncbi:MAG: hypothetical protein ACI8WB_004937 [Phenylobacterium sp.]|jgi:hypothetical protein